jgi:hypothetical protein
MWLKNSISSGITSISPKKLATITAFILAALTADAQMRVDGNIRVDGSIKNNGSTLIAPGANIAGDGVIHLDGNITNNKWTPDAFTPTSNASVVMTGTTPQTIGGTTPTNFPSITIDNLSWVELLQNQSVKNQLIFQQWLLDLNGKNIDLGTTWSLSWESDASRATDIADGGTISATRTFNAPTNQDPANLRENITSPDNLDITNIVRGHTQKISASGYGIYLWYVVTPTNTPTAGDQQSDVFWWWTCRSVRKQNSTNGKKTEQIEIVNMAHQTSATIMSPHHHLHLVTHLPSAERSVILCQSHGQMISKQPVTMDRSASHGLCILR